MEISPKYLVMITAENNNKFYRMIPEGNNFKVEFGRLGNTSFQTTSYPISQFEKKYKEKIKKGYVDNSDLIKDTIEEEEEEETTPEENNPIAIIVKRLQELAKQVIRKNYKISSTKVTQAMIDQAQDVLTKMVEVTEIEEINKLLLELFGIIPRKMHQVRYYLANNSEDIPKIIQREQDLLDVMSGQIYKKPKKKKTDSPIISYQKELEELGLTFEETTEEDVKLIKKMLGDQKNKYYNSWKITNNHTQERFDNFVKENKIKTNKLLWHGSRNENFWNIIKSGLLLRPTNVVITGKMFGYGSYFATSAGKSVGYCSLSGSRWASGTDDFGFLALFEVAYGTPFVVYDFDSRYYGLNYEKLQEFQPGANSLHAKKDKGMLRADEIVIYKEEQMTIKYLVEIRR